MSNLVYGPPEKFKALRDFIPCKASYGKGYCFFQYPTQDLLNQAKAAALLMGIVADDIGKGDAYGSPYHLTLLVNTKDLEDVDD